MENIQDSLKKITEKEQKDSDPVRTHCEKHGIELVKTHTDERLEKLLGREIVSVYCLNCEREEQKKQYRLSEEREVTDRRIYINNYISNAGLSPRFKEKTFENYKSKNEGQKKAVEACNWFFDNWQKSTGLIFIGGPGTGKNHLASALIKKFVENTCTSALFTEAIKIIRAIKESWRGQEKTETQVIKSFIEPNLLVIDEVGVQFGSDTERLYLTEIINDRYNRMKPTVLIGNVTLDEMRRAIGERAVERFKENGKVVVFDWKSHRGQPDD